MKRKEKLPCISPLENKKQGRKQEPMRLYDTDRTNIVTTITCASSSNQLDLESLNSKGNLSTKLPSITKRTRTISKLLKSKYFHNNNTATNGNMDDKNDRERKHPCDNLFLNENNTNNECETSTLKFPAISNAHNGITHKLMSELQGHMIKNNIKNDLEKSHKQIHNHNILSCKSKPNPILLPMFELPSEPYCREENTNRIHSYKRRVPAEDSLSLPINRHQILQSSKFPNYNHMPIQTTAQGDNRTTDSIPLALLDLEDETEKETKIIDSDTNVNTQSILLNGDVKCINWLTLVSEENAIKANEEMVVSEPSEFSFMSSAKENENFTN